MKRLTLIALVLFIAVACNQTHYKPEIKNVDDLLAKIDSADKQLAALDTVGLEKAGRNFKQKFQYIQQLHEEKGDTIGRDLAFLLSDFRSMRKPYARLKSEYAAAKKELDFSKDQLVNLRHDLENNLLDTNIVHKVVKTESEATEQAMIQAQKVVEKKTALDRKSAILLPKMDSIVAIIKENK